MNFKNADIKKLIDSGELTILTIIEKTTYKLQDKIGKIYYFKIASRQQNSWIKELLGEKIAAFLGYPTIHYERAIFDDSTKETKGFAYVNKSGVISENFRKEGSYYLDGMDIIHPYIDSLSDEKLLEYYGTLNRDDVYYRTNDLETIWNALEYRYKDRKDKNEIVSKLMNEITDFFEFTLIVGNHDADQSNYFIEETNDDVKLIPFFDYENIFTLFDKNRLSVEMSDNEMGFSTILSKYFNFVPRERIENFIKKFESLTEEIVTKFLDDIIEEYSLNALEKMLLLETKKCRIDNYKNHKNRLQIVIDEYNKGKSK